jgi:hypothetical protein
LRGASACTGQGTRRVLGSTRGYSTALAGGRQSWSTWVGTPGYSRGTARVLECAAAAARPRGRACSGAYVAGAAGSNECPAGSVRIATETACRTAATAAGKTVGTNFVETDPDYPRGCYYTTDWAYFNTHAVGDGNPTGRPLCAALATTGAPSAQRVHRRAACRHRACAAQPSRAVCVIHGRHIDSHTYK